MDFKGDLGGGPHLKMSQCKSQDWVRSQERGWVPERIDVGDEPGLVMLGGWECVAAPASEPGAKGRSC